MYWIYGLCAIAIAIKILLFPNPISDITGLEIVESVVQDTGIPNAVSGVIFRNRLYDTLFEVVVFSLATIGVSSLTAMEQPSVKIAQLTDSSSIVLARLGAMISTLIAIELAIRGHLSPGGGFAAGVAGGTAIGLITIATNPDTVQQLYQRWHIATLEKITVITFLVLAIPALTGVDMPAGSFGTLLSGGWIPILNILVAIKVAIGSWAAILAFIRAGGLL